MNTDKTSVKITHFSLTILTSLLSEDIWSLSIIILGIYHGTLQYWNDSLNATVGFRRPRFF